MEWDEEVSGKVYGDQEQLRKLIYNRIYLG